MSEKLQTLRTRTTGLLFVAAVLAPLAILIATGFLTYGQIHSDASLRVGRTAEALREHALRTFRAHDIAVAAVGNYVQGWDWRRIERSRDLHEFLESLAQGAEDINTVFLIDSSGSRGSTSLRYPLGAMDLRERPFFTGVRDSDALHLSEPDVGRLNRQPFFSFTRRRPAAQGVFDGLISISVNPTYFSEFYQHISETSQDVVTLLRADGVVMARFPDPGRLTRVNAQAMAGMLAAGEDGTFSIESPVDGRLRLHAFRKVGSYPLYVTYGLSDAAIWQSWRRAMLPYALVCLVAMAMLIAAALQVRTRLRRERQAAERAAMESARRSVAEEASTAKDAFIAALSHELRNPLSAIANGTEVLRRLHSDSQSGRALDIMGRQIHHLQSLLGDLLDVSRARFGKIELQPERVEAVEAIRAIVGDTTNAERITVAGAPVTVWADPVRLRQMIQNLLDNARKYGGPNVRVEVSREGRQAGIAVRDDGKGIAPELLPRLFEPFVQGQQSVERSQGGLGIGLSLVKRLAELHEGSLDVQSGPGGTMFTLRLPVAEAAKV